MNRQTNGRMKRRTNKTFVHFQLVSEMANVSEDLENESKHEKADEKQPRRRSICISSLWCLKTGHKGMVNREI